MQASIKNTPWYKVSDTASITNAVRAIALSTVSCTLALTNTGTVDGNVTRVRYVKTGSSKLLTSGTDYNISGNSVTLLGATCTDLKSTVQTDSSAHVEVELGCACVATTEVCNNGKDDDCDGFIDEGCPPPPTTCSAGAPADQCPTCPNPGLEICDGIDNNCNSLIDEGCMVCPDGKTASPEICDGIDNDCDGQVDEDCPPACTPAPEVCDGVDNNCNGQIDEGCGTICRPFAEICNGKDDNCNGIIDEGCAMCSTATAEVCDGIDNDCDGMIDEGCPPLYSPG
jgi:hypothetical protein